MKPYYKYAEDVIQNKIVCCSNIKLACQRFQEDLNRDDLEFRESVVDRAISFISTMKHFKGKASGQNFILEPWQQFVVANIVGMYGEGPSESRYSSSCIAESRTSGTASS